MKKALKIFLITLLVAGLFWSVRYLSLTNKKENITYRTTSASKKDIIKKTVATGSIKAKEEIDIKPNTSGIIGKILVKEGDMVKKGQIIAVLNVVPSINNLSKSQSQVNKATISLDNELRNYNRQKDLYKSGVISKRDYDNAQTSYLNAKEDLRLAKENYEIVRTGTSNHFANQANTQIRAKVSGMVLSIPVKVGDQVIESNSFNDGTTIATLANVSNMIFQGSIDESDIGKLKTGMHVKIKIGALPKQSFDGTLYFISPLGKDEDGAIKFDIKADIKLKKEIFIRAGYSANAEIILDHVKNVLTINEGVLKFEEKGKPYVEIATGNPEKPFEKKYVKLGLSDGINVEVKSGLSKKDKIKILNTNLKSANRRGRR